VNTSVVTPQLRARVRGLAIPVALAFGRIGLTPNALTVIGFGIAIGAGVAASQEAWVLAGMLVIFGGVFDLFDGALARATNTVSRLGAFLDSVFDRAGEAILYIGIAIGCLAGSFEMGAILAAAAMAASFMVSYTRAKSESLGFTPGTGMANVGVAPREVRLVLLTIGLLLTQALGSLHPDPSLFVLIDGSSYGGRPVLAGTLGLITVLATITTIQRIVHVSRQAPPDATPPGGHDQP
jgi:CDP-diacylglycerol--glycerol-3-phosphate 3-phosphatidyltransferase